MDPQQFNQQPPLPSQPQQTPPVQPTTSPTTKKSRLPTILMVWPIVTFIAIVMLYALINMLIPDQPPTGEELFGSTPPAKAAINAVLYLLGTVNVIFGPISFIVGLVLLVKQKSKQNAQN